MQAIAEIGPRRWQSALGRPPDKYVAALKVLMAMLGRLKRRDGKPLKDSEMARLVALVFPVLLRINHKKVLDLVRKHRRSFFLHVVDKPDVQKVTIIFYEQAPLETADFVGIRAMWPGIEVEMVPLSGQPPYWRRRRDGTDQSALVPKR